MAEVNSFCKMGKECFCTFLSEGGKKKEKRVKKENGPF